MMGKCDFCPSEYAPESNTQLLCISGTEAQVTLCAFHEGELLMTLLKNYIRRKKKCSRTGWTKPLLKPDHLPIDAIDIRDLVEGGE